MGVQLLEGDWDVAVQSAGKPSTAATTNPSARQRRWTAFRSWYRGGRVFDKAHETLIAAAMLRRPPSPASQGRPLTPHIAPPGRLQSVAPSTEDTPTQKDGESDAPMNSHQAVEAAEAAGPGSEVSGAEPFTPVEGIRRTTVTPHAPPPPPSPTLPLPQPMVHVVDLKTKGAKPASSGRASRAGKTSVKDEGKTVAQEVVNLEKGTVADSEENVSGIFSLATEGGQLCDTGDDFDAARLDGIAGWEEDKTEAQDAEGGGAIAEGLPPRSRESSTAAAKGLRMEARRKFLAARTVMSNEAATKASAILCIRTKLPARFARCKEYRVPT